MQKLYLHSCTVQSTREFDSQKCIRMCWGLICITYLDISYKNWDLMHEYIVRKVYIAKHAIQWLIFHMSKYCSNQYTSNRAHHRKAHIMFWSNMYLKIYFFLLKLEKIWFLAELKYISILFDVLLLFWYDWFDMSWREKWK